MDLKSDELKKNLARPRSIPVLSALEAVVRSFSPGERLLLYVLSVSLAASALSLLAGANAAVSIVEPARGGAFSEGIIGSPRFINPVLAISQADEDMAKIVYSGLTEARPDGSVAPGMAEKYEISEDGTVYTFTLRKTAVFHDGAPVTSADVLFTVAAAQNPEVKSPRRADWEGVSVSAPDPRTVIFKLQHAYAPFLENTTLGILPKHLWESVSAEEFHFSPLNTHPVGSGPFRVSASQNDATGAAVSYTLSAFGRFAPDRPYLDKITLMFYPNEEALIRAFNEGAVDALAGVSPAALPALKRDDVNIMHVPLPRVFGVFFNQGHAPALADASARAALLAAIDKRALVNAVLKGYGAVLESPIPPGVLREGDAPAKNPDTENADPAALARKILERGGWVFDEKTKEWRKSVKGGSPAGGGRGASGGKQALSFALATADTPELTATAEALADYWRAAGINVSVRVYSLSELNTGVIRPRAYDAILFGEIVGRTLDLFAFWHSSQRNDPGLNLAMYANSKADALLSSARAAIGRKEREKLYGSFASIIAKDQPAAFLYSPDFIYAVPKNLSGVELGALTTPSERFLNVREWYTDTERVWNFFTKNTNE